MNAPEPDTITPLPEEILDRWVNFLEGPVNRRAEKIMKSKLFLAPMGAGWTLWCRSILAVKHGKPQVMWRGVDALED